MKEYSPNITAERIKKIAKDLKMPVSELSKTCGMSKSTVTQSGKSADGMKAKNLFLIAETLGCSVDYLLGRTDVKDVCSMSNCITNNQQNLQVVGGNNEVKIDNHVSDTEKELQDILSKLSYRKRTELMSLVYKFLDDVKD